jgi:hypothetical protein
MLDVHHLIRQPATNRERHFVNYTLVDIGIGSSYDFFFEVAWPNYREVSRNPSPISALNAAWPFWHLHEWYFWEHHPFASNNDLRRYVDQILLQDCPELGQLRDIAEAGKHFKLNRTNPPIRVRAISIREEFGGGIGEAPLGATPIGAGSGLELFVDVGGTTQRLQHALGRAFRYWLGKVLPHQSRDSLFARWPSRALREHARLVPRPPGRRTGQKMALDDAPGSQRTALRSAVCFPSG